MIAHENSGAAAARQQGEAVQGRGAGRAGNPVNTPGALPGGERDASDGESGLSPSGSRPRSIPKVNRAGAGAAAAVPAPAKYPAGCWMSGPARSHFVLEDGAAACSKLIAGTDGLPLRAPFKITFGPFRVEIHPCRECRRLAGLPPRTCCCGACTAERRS